SISRTSILLNKAAFWQNEAKKLNVFRQRGSNTCFIVSATRREPILSSTCNSVSAVPETIMCRAGRQTPPLGVHATADATPRSRKNQLPSGRGDATLMCSAPQFISPSANLATRDRLRKSQVASVIGLQYYRAPKSITTAITLGGG